jgi:hypothetical protein
MRGSEQGYRFIPQSFFHPHPAGKRSAERGPPAKTDMSRMRANKEEVDAGGLCGQ